MTRPKNFKIILAGIFLVVGVFSLVTSLILLTSSQQQGVENISGNITTNARLEADPVTYSDFADINDCFSNTGEKLQVCLDDFVDGYFGEQTTQEVLAAMESARLENTSIENNCHPIAHAIGRHTYKTIGNVGDAFEACDQSCHSGCYHGVMERLFWGEDELIDENKHLTYKDLETKIPGICSADKFQNPSNSVIFQCLHGVGHAILYSLDYDLSAALKSCDLLATEYEKSSCYGGVVMENVTAFDKQKRDLKKDDPLYPCNSLESHYQYTCYLMQTSVMFEYGMDIPTIAENCKQATNYQNSCFTSLGRDLSNDVRLNNPQRVVEACEVYSGEYSESCINGTVYALVDNTWDARFAYQFCSLLNSTNKAYCYKAVNNYLKWSYSKSADDLKESCATFAQNETDTCLANM